MHYVSVMKIRKIRELQLTNVRTLLIQVRLGPTPGYRGPVRSSY